MVPSKAAKIGVPEGAAQSTPLWTRTTPRIGCLRGPKVEVMTPLTGVTMPLLTVTEWIWSCSVTQAKSSAPGRPIDETLDDFCVAADRRRRARARPSRRLPSVSPNRRAAGGRHALAKALRSCAARQVHDRLADHAGRHVVARGRRIDGVEQPVLALGAGLRLGARIVEEVLLHPRVDAGHERAVVGACHGADVFRVGVDRELHQRAAPPAWPAGIRPRMATT